MTARAGARRLSDAQVRLLRACDLAGQVQVASMNHAERRTARSLERQGLIRREASGILSVVALTERGRAATRRDPAPAARRILPRGAETTRASGRRRGEAERRAARERARLLAEEEVARWNRAHPVGTLVDYCAVLGEPPTERRRTRTEAQALNGDVPVVWLEGKAGCVLLAAVRPAPDDIDRAT